MMKHGGRRDGAGRPRTTISEKSIKDLVRAFRKKAKETGKDWAEILAEWAFDDSTIEVIQNLGAGKKVIVKKPNIEIRDRMRAIELYSALVVTKKSEHVVEQKKINIIEMPALQEDPTKQILEERRRVTEEKEYKQ
jgi:hypothetical protein